MKKEALYRPLSIALPILAILSASGVSGYQWRRLKVVEGDAALTEGKLAQIDRELRSFEAQPPSEKFPTVAKTPREQAEFLDALRANADVSNVQLVRWSNTTPQPAAPQQGAQPGDKPASGPTAGVSSIVSIIEVSGRAENSRRFLYNVTRSRRLYNLSEIKWARDTWPNTHLTFTLTRYVAPPVSLPNGRSPAALAAGPQLNPADSRPAAPGGGAVAAAAPGTTASGGTLGAPAALGGRIAGAVAEHGPLPNPMDAPGIAHRTYQSRLESGVSKLNDMDPSQSSDAQRPTAVTNARR